MSEIRKAITRLSLDVSIVDVAQKSIAITKGDVNRRFEITLVNSGFPISVGKLWTAVLVGRKPDDKVLYNSCVIENGRIIYDFENGPEISTCEGSFEIRFEIFDEYGQTLASPAVWLNVINFPGKDLASKNESTAIGEMIGKINEAYEAIDATNQELDDLKENIKIPVYDLAAMGMPSIPVVKSEEDAVAELETETAELLYNLSFGPVKFKANVKIDDETYRTMVFITNGVSGSCFVAFNYMTDYQPAVLSILIRSAAEATESKPKGISAFILLLQTDANADNRISTLEEQMDDLLYAQNPFTIKSFTNDVGTVEIGSTVEKVTLKWVFNREPESVLIGPYTSDAKKITPSISGSFEPEDGLNLHLGSPGTRKWKILAKHEKDDLYQETTTTVTFANRIWYGAAEEPEAYDSAFVKSLSNSLLQNSKPASITVNATTGKYIFYCQPVRLGSATFTFGANEGGVSYITGISVENDSGYTERYSIYRSDNPGLGNTTLGVK